MIFSYLLRFVMIVTISCLPITHHDSIDPVLCTDKHGRWYGPGSLLSLTFNPYSNTCQEGKCSSKGRFVSKIFPNSRIKLIRDHAPSPYGCFEGGKYYAIRQHINQIYNESSNTCYGSFCDLDGEILMWEKHPCKSTFISQTTTLPPATTTSQPATTTPPPTTPCYGRHGQAYAPGEKISESYVATTNWCFGLLCNQDGRIEFWDRQNCKSSTTSTTPSTTVTTSPPTQTTITPKTKPNEVGCYDKYGLFFAPGKKMSTNFVETLTWCYGLLCNQHGKIEYWDRMDCTRNSIIPVTTTAPPSTTFPPTTAFGCYGDNGKLFSPGEKMSEGFDESSNWCYGTYCDQHGQIVSWDNWECKPTTVPPATTTPMTTEPSTPTTTPKTTPFGCYKNGKYYAPGETIDGGYDETTNWCYGSVCSENGQILQWDNFQCKSTTVPPTTTSPMTTEPYTPTTIPKTTPFGCYENGKYYAPGETIEEGYDESTNWCYGSVCSESGHITYWDNFECKKIPTTIPTTTIPG